MHPDAHSCTLEPAPSPHACRRRIPVPDPRPAPSPLWLRLLGAAVLALMGAGLGYAVVIGLLRFPSIGV